MQASRASKIGAAIASGRSMFSSGAAANLSSNSR
jgi:hypothetical protein